MLISGFFLFLSCIAALSFASDKYRSAFISHGKLAALGTGQHTCDSITRLVEIRIPRMFFCHFYISGLFWSFTLLISRVRTIQGTSIQYLFMVHLLRRVCESIFLEHSSALSSMIFGHYILGNMFYFCTCWALSGFGLRDNTIYPVLSFFLVSYNQHQCHRYLASVRKSAWQSTYVYPDAPWFRLVFCPHYLFETILYMILYFSVDTPDKDFLCCAIWVVTNLSVLSVQQKVWYKTQLRLTQKYHLLPFIF